MRAKSTFSLLAAVGLLSALAACAGVPQYDPTTDANVSALQNEIDVTLVDWIADVQSSDPSVKANATYAKNVAFYKKVDTDMLSLELRMEAVPDASTKNLPEYFNNLRQMVDNLKTTQQADDGLKPPAYFDPGVLQQTRWQFAAQFAPLITYEQTLKGVGSPKDSTTSSAATNTANTKAAATPTKK